MGVARKTYPTCERDGFPKVKIGGRWECVAEYLDRCIGQKRVVDLVQRGETVYHVFEDGHELPVLCFCCGKPLVFKNLDRARRDIVGRRLEGMSFDLVELKDGSEVIQFRLELSKKRWLSRRVYAKAPPEVAVRLRHPPDCPRRGGSPKAKKSRSKRRRRR